MGESFTTIFFFTANLWFDEFMLVLYENQDKEKVKLLFFVRYVRYSSVPNFKVVR